MPRGGGGSSRGYKPGGIYLRPGSLTTRALETLRNETLRLQHALTVAQWRAAFARDTGETSDLLTVAANLRKRGLIVVVGGRTRSLQYCTASDPVPAALTVDQYAIIEQLVRDACQATGFAVPMDALTRSLSTRGITLTSDQLGRRLVTLATRSEGRAVTDQVGARLECVHAQGTLWARSVRFWRPIGTQYLPPTELPPTRSAAMRMAVDAVTKTLGWTPTPPEVKAWLAAHADAAPSQVLVARVASTRFAAGLRTLASKDRNDLTGLKDETSPMATDGGIVMRVALRDREQVAVVTARYLDLCYLYRPGDELASCARLSAEADTLRAPALAALGRLRQQALAHAIGEAMHVACNGHPVPWDEIARRVDRGAEILHEWWCKTRNARNSRPGRAPIWLARVEAAHAALPALRAAVAITDQGAPLGLAGGVGMRSLAIGVRWVKEILAPEGISPERPRELLHDVRRVPNPMRQRGPLYDDVRVDFSHLDAGDLLECLSRLTSHAQIAVLLQTAVDVLGYTVRDPGLLRWFLGELPPYERLYRHGAAIGLAALGAPISPEDTMRNMQDEDGLVAYALGLSISTMGVDEREKRLRALWGGVAPDLRDRVRELIDRTVAGDNIAVVM